MPSTVDWLPRYVQVMKFIEGKIDDGSWGPHHQIPSEDLLCEQFQFARGTIRQAINELVIANKLYKIQGKGTFVGPERLQADVNASHFRSFLSDFIDKKIEFKTELLSREVIEATSRLQKAFNCSAKTRMLMIRRIRTVDGVPFMYSENFLEYDRFPGVEKLDYSRGLYTTLEMEYGVHFGSVQHYIEAVSTEEWLAKLLQVKSGTPVIFAEQIEYDTDSRCLDDASIWIRSDKVRLSVKHPHQM